ncbi:cytochrome c oxidase subunit 3 [Mycobacterium sp. AT1]|uniref:cytochrome c oxidase subunit 3 n=1 Tax=Mycobacterium sp. AT1 TaxID=1961706 RepID=UPI001301E5BB|nr:cytochrome c oxidase subunit 3 [Mycobacterium sp. AT1]
MSDRSATSRTDRIPGEPGVWVFLICEMVVFTALFGVIAFNASHNRMAFAVAQQVLNTPLGLINTCVLIGGSVLVMLAIAEVQQQQRHSKAARLMAVAMACGVTFAVIKGIEYASVLQHGMWIHTNVFWLLFFAVTGAHLLHVFVGVTVLGLARRAVAKGLPGSRDRDLFLSAACYWHLVDLLWLVIFPLFYLVN